MVGRLTSVLLLAVSALSGMGMAVVGADTDFGVVTTSPNDQREYHAFELANRLKVLLISDPTTDKSAAALDVNVGNGGDPVDRQGLAHFLEHMLFLGTEKYPRAGEYQEFIRRHGGANNAYTSYEHTNYFFDIDPDYLEPALDRFAQFFVAPLFTEEYVERERGIVHSEYSSRKQSDGRRTWAARKAVFNPKHPMSRFSVGSLSTLEDRPGKPVRDDLIEFHRRYYSANAMTLVVFGREPISILRQWVSERFEEIEDKNQSAFDPGEKLFVAGRLPVRLTVNPIKEQRVLSLTFPIPEVRTHYRTKPTALISNLIGHEGRGSLLAVLKRRGLAEGLSAGIGVSNPNEATFVVSISLTKAGATQWREVAGLLFDYIDLVKREGVADWIYREQRMLADLSFRFQEQQDPGRYAQALASNLHRYPAAELLVGPYMMESFEPALINKFLSSLRPENVLVTVIDQDQPTRSVEQWYGTEYAIDEIDAALISDWGEASIDSDLQLPPPNPFLPDVNLLQLAPQSVGSIPQRILDLPGFELWHHQDVSFRVPRANYYMSIRSPLANSSARNSVLTSLYVRAVNDELNAFSYPANLAGLNYSFYHHVRGVTLKISGYSAKQALLLERIVETMREPSIDTAKFELYRQELIRTLRNRSQDTPYSQTLSEVRRLLMIPDWTSEERIAAALTVSKVELERFIGRFYTRVDVVGLSHGNVERDEAVSMASLVRTRLLANAQPQPVPRGRLVRLPLRKTYLRTLDVDHDDAAISEYVQGDDAKIATRARFALLAQLVSTAFYNDLRTQNQLGYVVFASPYSLSEVPGLVFVVQSPTASPAVIESHINRFIREFADRLAEMTDDEYGAQRQGLLSRILERAHDLNSRSGRYWNELDDEEYEFDSRHRLASAVREIGREEFVAFYRATLLQRNRFLIVQTPGQSGIGSPSARPANTAYRRSIEHPHRFKRDKALFPAG